MEQIVHAPQDLTYLSWSKIRNSSGTAGSFLKSQETTPNGKIFYKLSDYDAFHGITGHESVNEIIADRLLSILDILFPHDFFRVLVIRVCRNQKRDVGPSGGNSPVWKLYDCLSLIESLLS